MIKSVKVWTGYKAKAPFEIDSDPWYTCYGLLHSWYGTPEPAWIFLHAYYLLSVSLWRTREKERKVEKEGKRYV